MASHLGLSVGDASILPKRGFNAVFDGPEGNAVIIRGVVDGRVMVMVIVAVFDGGLVVFVGFVVVLVVVVVVGLVLGVGVGGNCKCELSCCTGAGS